MAYEVYKSQWSRPVKAVLFDMDGLVLDTEKLYSRFWMEACHFYGFPMTYGQSLCMRALNAQLGEAKLKEFFGDTIDYLAVRSKRVELMERYVDECGVDLKPGIRELLQWMQENGIPGAIASSSPVPRIRKYLAFHGLDGAFTALCSARDVARGKPEPDIYLHAAATLGFAAEECLALEDAPSGIRSATSAGCLTVMIPDQDQPTEEMKQLLYAKADSLADVIDILNDLR